MLQPAKRLPLYASFLTIGAFITLFVLLASPSDPENAILLGYSLERILLALAILIPGIALLFLTLNLFRQPVDGLNRAQQSWKCYLSLCAICFHPLLGADFYAALPPWRTGRIC